MARPVPESTFSAGTPCRITAVVDRIAQQRASPAMTGAYRKAPTKSSGRLISISTNA
jgi:hypothetical protein